MILTRTYYPDVTLGKIVGATVSMVTLERPWLNNQHGISCIPEGDYLCDLFNHPQHGFVYEVRDVPDRTAILFHIGNFVHDTEGCILLGLNYAKDMKSIEHSSDAFKVFMMLMQGVNTFSLTIRKG